MKQTKKKMEKMQAFKVLEPLVFASGPGDLNFLQTSKEGWESPSLKIPWCIGVLMNRVTLTDLEELD